MVFDINVPGGSWFQQLNSSKSKIGENKLFAPVLRKFTGNFYQNLVILKAQEPMAQSEISLVSFLVFINAYFVNPLRFICNHMGPRMKIGLWGFFKLLICFNLSWSGQRLTLASVSPRGKCVSPVWLFVTHLIGFPFWGSAMWCISWQSGLSYIISLVHLV